jgi:hypothetical protein
VVLADLLSLAVSGSADRLATFMDRYDIAYCEDNFKDTGSPDASRPYGNVSVAFLGDTEHGPEGRYLLALKVTQTNYRWGDIFQGCAGVYSQVAGASVKADWCLYKPSSLPDLIVCGGAVVILLVDCHTNRAMIVRKGSATLAQQVHVQEFAADRFCFGISIWSQGAMRILRQSELFA